MTELTEEQKEMLKKLEECPKFGTGVDEAAAVEMARNLSRFLQTPE